MKKIGIFTLGVFLLMSGSAWALTAKADIYGTAPDSKIAGTATFEETPAGLSMDVKVSNVSPGLHGFHIHEKGSCDEQGNAAGGHYNPMNVKHGFLLKDGMEGAHAGDFGNIEVGPTGEGELKLTLPGLSIRGGAHDVEGHAVILHAKQDDFGQPTGNAGGRIGCGVIQANE